MCEVSWSSLPTCYMLHVSSLLRCGSHDFVVSFGRHVTILDHTIFAIMTHLQGVPFLRSSKSACSLTLVAAFVLLDYGRCPLSDPSGKTV